MDLRENITALLGSDWQDTTLELVDDRQAQNSDLRTLTFRTSSGETAKAAYLPSRTGAAILYCHAHGNRYDIGVSELHQGRPALESPWLPELAKRGWGVLCLEMPCFGSRANQSESSQAKKRLWQGRTLFGQMLGEQRAALNWLVDTENVNAEKIAVIGVSMGGTLAWWLASLEPKFAAAVSIACFADLENLISTGAHDGHGIYMVVPGLLQSVSTGSLCGLAAPTRLMHCVGYQDWSTPEEAFAIARRDLDDSYHRDGCPPPEYVIDRRAGHEETPEMRRKVLRFLEDVLAE